MTRTTWVWSSRSKEGRNSARRELTTPPPITDPVTGSAHCCLADFWRKRLGKTEFVAFQASSRGGVVKVRVVKDRAVLGGKAITVARGELLVEGDEP